MLLQRWSPEVIQRFSVRKILLNNKTRGHLPVLNQGWASVCDAGPPLNQHWRSVICHIGKASLSFTAIGLLGCWDLQRNHSGEPNRINGQTIWCFSISVATSALRREPLSALLPQLQLLLSSCCCYAAVYTRCCWGVAVYAAAGSFSWYFFRNISKRLDAS